MSTRSNMVNAHPGRMSKIFYYLIVPAIIVLVMTGCSPAAPEEDLPQTGPTVETEPATQPPSPPTTQAPTMEPVDQPTDTRPPAVTDTQETGMQLDPCSTAAVISMIQTAVPVTPTATGEGPSASPTPQPATPTPRPAPTEDRIGFPTGYEDNYLLMFVYDRVDNRQVRVVCGNEAAASVKQGEPFPHGSILVMETWRAKIDADGNVVKDSDGHFVRESLTGIFVMKKDKGFGEAYQGLRTGEWEYVAFRPDQSYLAPPENTANCASCHIGAGEEKDWVFRAGVLFFDPDRYAAAQAPGENEILINSMSFGPRTIQVKAGTEVSWTNHDGSNHTVMFEDGSVNSGELEPGESFQLTLSEPGTYHYHCSIHPEQMMAVIEVE